MWLSSQWSAAAHKESSQYSKKHAAANTVRHQTSAEQQLKEQVALPATG